MNKWKDVNGPIVADTVYDDGQLVGRDVSFTLPGINFLTADIPAMGNLSVPLIGLMENMEASVTSVGVDRGLGKLSRLDKHNLEFRWVQTVIKSDGSQANVGCKAFLRTLPPGSLPELGVEVGNATEAENTYNVTRQQIFADGYEVMCVDRLAHVLRIDGKDYYKDIENLL